jgi:uncharacterized protein (DUF362 family)
MTRVAETEFTSYDATVPRVLDAVGAAAVLRQQTTVLLKPNLVNASPPPVTTPVECVEALVEYVRACSRATVVVGEGCGAAEMETPEVFRRLGYTEMARRLGVELIDLNHAPLRRLARPECEVFPEMHLPEIALAHYLISVPVLKAHSLADVTGTMKNMMGLCPPEHYAGGSRGWKKAVFHRRMHESIIDLNRYRTPDLTLLDATVGMAEFHLGGAHCDPPVNKLLASFDPLAIDRRGAELLRIDWRQVGHLAECGKAALGHVGGEGFDDVPEESRPT